MTFEEQINEANKQFANEHPISVSKCIGYLSKEFDKDGVAQKCYEKGLGDPNSKYYGMTKDDILAMWEAKAETSKQYGRLLDEYIGMYFNNEDTGMWKLDNNFDDDERLKNNIKGFTQFINVLSKYTNYVFVARELPLYMRTKSDNLVQGRFDCLFQDTNTKRYLLIDWKTTEVITRSNKFEKFLGPLFSMEKCDMNEYTLQLHIYKKALCETYKICDPSMIDVKVCQMIQTPNDKGMNYNIQAENFFYNPTLLDKVVDFSVKKHALSKLLSKGN